MAGQTLVPFPETQQIAARRGEDRQNYRSDIEALKVSWSA